MRELRNKAFFLAALLCAAGLGGYLAVRTTGPAAADEQVGNVPTVTDPARAADDKTIRAVQSAYVKAFNAGDAKALAAFWAADGEFVDAAGTVYRGRAVIEKEFAAFFADAKGAKLEITTDALRFVGPDVALESGRSRVVRPDGTGAASAYSIVHNKRNGRWLLASVREMPYAPASNYEHLRDIEWLVGNWTAKGANVSLEMSCEWTAKRNFMVRKYQLKSAAGAAKNGIQIIGWDPLEGGIRAWVFDSDGGFGSETWTKDGKRWVLEAAGVTRDGAEVLATNILTPIDLNSFSWQSVGRSLNEVALPDTAVIKVTRVKSSK